MSYRDAVAEQQRDLQGYLQNWATVSGRALELRVAQAARVAPADYVEQSFTFIDPVHHAEREGDVAATFYWGDGRRLRLGAISLVMECKFGGDSPWVGFLDRGLPLRDRTLDYVTFTGLPDDSGVAQPPELDWQLAGGVSSLLCSHLVVAKIGTRGDRNTAYDAVRQATSAAAGHLRLEPVDWSATVAAVVLDNQVPLFTCHLSENDDVVFEEVPALRVREGGRWVWVTLESELPRLLEHIRALAGRAHQRAQFERESH